MLDFGDDTLKTFPDVAFANRETLLPVMSRLLAEAGIPFVSTTYRGLGVLVTRIGSRKNGDGGKYWQYWVNDRHPDVGADQYVLAPGDVVEWKFTAFQGE